MTLKELVLSLLPHRASHVSQRVSVLDVLRERERLAEQEAEAALNGLRAVRLEYDPRAAPNRAANSTRSMRASTANSV